MSPIAPYLENLISYYWIGMTFPTFRVSDYSFLLIFPREWTPYILGTSIIVVAILIRWLFKRLQQNREKKISEAINLVKKSIEQVPEKKEKPSQQTSTIDPSPTTEFEDEWVNTLNINAKKLIENKQFSIVELAASMNLSERQFRRKLKQKTGMLPVAFMREARLQKAKQLLISGAFPTVTLVCYEVGFSTPKHFSKLFQERFGNNPSFYLSNNSDIKKP